MAVFKCKMCGGALEVEQGQTVATCEYCGTQQTLPKLDDDRRVNLYDRANHFRRNNEFDKAMGIYEQILTEDNTDAEAYWSLVLCRYGIEYVEDPATRKRIPTVNRAQFTSIFDDDNYKSALEHGDGYQRHIFEEEARAINEIQKGILAISQKEEPFDVFICYKETDQSGRRTPDSVLANDLYHQLTQEGFKVFFARITLEDKLGTAYEPYIFAALNSAKVMVVLGTKPEYFNAVWVKNEWSRYLGLIKQGEKKMLIPAYKDMDPYDLPEEFSHLQAQDMSKLGFMQDLIRGIKKIVQADEPKTTVVKETVVSGGNTNIEPLLKRAFMFLEDGDWRSADEYCEKVLDIDPENASAYLGKLLSENRARRKESLKDCAEPFGHSNNFKKAVRFGDKELKSELSSYLDCINTRNENARLDGIYNHAKEVMLSADTENAYKEAAQLFYSISEYQDSAALAKECYEKADASRKDAILVKAQSIMENDMLSSYENALELYESIPGWKDADDKANECKRKLELKKAKAEEKQKEREVRNKNRKRFAKIGIPLVIIIALAVVLYDPVIAPRLEMNSRYNDAVDVMDSGRYTLAVKLFERLDGYKDSEDKIVECNDLIKDEEYNEAISLMNSGKTIEAFDAFVALNGYKDSAEKAKSIYTKYNIENLKSAKAGDYVYFGSYEQDNDDSNGKEYIEWIVLDVKDGKALVLSRYALDCKPYNTEKTDVTWETCTLRNWLNNDFINVAFTNEENAMISEVTVSADTNSGNSTQDKVFLLSISEVNKYFHSDRKRQCKATDYAVSNGAFVYGPNCSWWLRTPGYTQSDAAYVYYTDGDVEVDGIDVDWDSNAVRPAMWIDLNY